MFRRWAGTWSLPLPEGTIQIGVVQSDVVALEVCMAVACSAGVAPSQVLNVSL